jgi:hypothetical protein
MSINKDHCDDSKPTQEELQKEIDRLGLENKSINYLRGEVAELNLINGVLTKQLAEFREKHITDTMELIKILKNRVKPHLKSVLVERVFDEVLKKAPAISGNSGGLASKKVNRRHQFREEIKARAEQAKQSGELHRHKLKWISAILEEPKYKNLPEDEKLSADTLYREIKLKD